MAGCLEDGLITVGVHTKLVGRCIAAGGAGKPRYAEVRVCWAPEEAEARRLAIAQAVICGPDPAPHIAAITQAAKAGYTHVWVHQIGPDQAGFFQFHAHEVLPKLR
jgi:hypothetical protein